MLVPTSSNGRSKAPEATSEFPRILTTYRKGGLSSWLERVVLLEDLDTEVAQQWGKHVGSAHQLRRDWIWAWRLFRMSRDFDAVVTGSDRLSRMFAILQRVLRRRRVPHVYIDWLCNVEGGNRFSRIVRCAHLRWSVLGASRALVQGKAEVSGYAAELGVPTARFQFVPYHSTIYTTPFHIEAGDYIFSGGDGNRDYPSLIAAVRGLPFRTKIAALSFEHFVSIDMPQNVEVVPLSQGDYIQAMASSRVVVVPIRGELLHPGGQQTWLNAMAMGKPVIVAEDQSARDYIEDGVSGLLVPPGDVEALRHAIKSVMENPGLGCSLGRAAQIRAASFTPERFCDRVLSVVEECVGEARRS